MELIEKLNLLVDLNERERNIAIKLFLGTIALLDKKEMEDILTYLSSKNVKIKSAKDIKILTIPKDELVKKFDILKEVNADYIYIAHPSLLNINVIDIYKRINYCIKNNIEYKESNEMYAPLKPFIFSEKEWQKTFNKESSMVNDVTPLVDEEIPTLEPVFNETEMEKEPLNEVNTFNMPIQNVNEINEDIKSLNNRSSKVEEIADGLRSLKEQLASLDSLGEISFNDIEPESYSRGRAA